MSPKKSPIARHLSSAVLGLAALLSLITEPSSATLRLTTTSSASRSPRQAVAPARPQATLPIAPLPKVLPAAAGTPPPQFQQPTVLLTGSWPVSIESADLNSDGRPDLIYTDYGATATASTTHVLLNNGDGTFTPGQSILTSGTSIAVADFDRDGHADLEWVYSIRGEGRVFFAKGNGDATFAPAVELGTFAQIGNNLPHFEFLTAAPMHDTGYLDLLIEDTANDALFELTADASGTLVRLFGIHLPDGTGPMTPADLNGDGHTDVVLQGKTSANIFLGSPDGIISTPTQYPGPAGLRSLLLQDFDADGHPDLLFESSTGHLDLFHGLTDGTFSPSPSGGTATLDPTTGAGGHLLAFSRTNTGSHLYTATPAGISLLNLQSDLTLQLQSIFNAGPTSSLNRATTLVADFNNDGSPDIAVASPEGVALLFGNPDGTLRTSYAFATSQPALSGTLGAFNPSGTLDALVALNSTEIQLLHGHPDGTFSPASASAAIPGNPTPTGPLLTGDFNADGNLDLALPTTAGLYLRYGHSDGTFSPATSITRLLGTALAANLSTSAATALATSDATGDDLLSIQPGGAPASTTLATATTPGLIAAGDLNHDGLPDLIFQNGSVWTVYLNASTPAAPAFSPALPLPAVPVEPNLAATSALVADLDGDGNGDILIAFDNTLADHAHPTPSTPSRLYIWYGHGDGTFSEPVLLTPSRNFSRAIAADTTGSGRLDLVLTDGFLVGILHNLGNRTFSPEQHLLAGTGLQTLSAADLNHDGTMDLVVTNGSSAPPAGTGVANGAITVLLNIPSAQLDTSHGVTGVPSTVLFTLTSSSTLFFGQSVDGIAKVEASDNSQLSGTLTFYDGATNICVIPVVANLSCPAATGSGFVAGPHILTAVYSGDTTHAGSTSNLVTVTIEPDITTATLTSSLHPAPLGQSLSLTATLYGNFAVPDGTVTFLDGFIVLGTATLANDGTATVPTSILTLGTHFLTVTYAGTPNFINTTSDILSQRITPALGVTATMLSSNANPALIGQPVTLTANVVPVPAGAPLGAPQHSPSGLVSFLDNSPDSARPVVLGTAMLDASGLANFATSTLSVGNHLLTASYSGDVFTSASLSASFLQTVTVAPAPDSGTFTIGVGPVALATGETANLLVKVAGVNGFNQPVQLTCANLPTAASCVFTTSTIAAGGGSTNLKLVTRSPGACGSATSYNQSASNRAGSIHAVSVLAAPALAGMLLFFLPFSGSSRRRTAWRGLLTLLATAGFLAISGCGACTDLGTRPGTYTIQVNGTAVGSTHLTVSRTVQVTVNP